MMQSFSELFREAFSRRPASIGKQAGYSPFGFGRCVFPLFSNNNITAAGLGSGFFMKNFDLGITAEHLMDVASIDIPDESGVHELNLSRAKHGITALLPLDAVIFGPVAIPQDHCQPVQRFMFDLVDQNDPLATLRGRRSFSRRSDVLFMEFPAGAARPASEARPRLSGDIPAVGDWVCAVGFPDIEATVISHQQLQILVSELGIAISFARVTEIVLAGRGRNETTPVVLVESDWPGGMSGGPVFNASGRVLGVVSRELVTAKGQPNQGSFTLLSGVMSRLSY